MICSYQVMSKIDEIRMRWKQGYYYYDEALKKIAEVLETAYKAEASRKRIRKEEKDYFRKVAEAIAPSVFNII